MADRIQITLDVQGMTCDGCAAHVAKALHGVAGVDEATGPSWRAARATVVAGADVSDETLARAVEAAGYRARVRERRALREGQRFPAGGEAYDLMVIGGGSAAFAAAIKGAELGAKVAIVEHGTIGGICVNIGCVPSKTLIKAAELCYRSAYPKFEALTACPPPSDWQRVIQQKDELVAALRQGKYVDVMKIYPTITPIQGRATLTGKRTVTVNSTAYTPSKVLVATGSRPWAPPIPGLAEAGYLDSTEALSLPELPASLLVIGGGAIGLETDRTWIAATRPEDDHLAPDGRVMEILSEHTCQGWLEGYLLTGRHGLFSSYEAFIHIVDSMFNQHAKWLKVTREIPWRAPIASLNYLLTSHVWRQDHNGFSHQDPGFIDHVVNKKADVIRVYLPPDANTLLSVMDHCLRSRHYVNVVVAGKNPEPQYLDVDAAVKHCTAGIGIWEWASNDDGGEPDVVMACAGDVPTQETLAAVKLLRQHIPALKIRVVNVVDLMRLQPREEHPHGLSDREFDTLFTTDRPIIFAYHGYPWLVHRLTYRRTNHGNLHVRGYKEEGTTTTPFDMLVRNDMDRFHLVSDVIDRVPTLGYRAAHLKQALRDKLIEHRAYITTYGQDLPEIREWTWTDTGEPRPGRGSTGCPLE